MVYTFLMCSCKQVRRTGVSFLGWSMMSQAWVALPKLPLCREVARLHAHTWSVGFFSYPSVLAAYFLLKHQIPHSKENPESWILPQNPEWFRLEKILKIISFQPLATGRDIFYHLRLFQALSSLCHGLSTLTVLSLNTKLPSLSKAQKKWTPRALW